MNSLAGTYEVLVGQSTPLNDSMKGWIEFKLMALFGHDVRRRSDSKKKTVGPKKTKSVLSTAAMYNLKGKLCY